MSPLARPIARLVGAENISTDPAVLAALRPAYAVDFMFAYPLAGFLVLGAVFLLRALWR